MKNIFKLGGLFLMLLPLLAQAEAPVFKIVFQIKNYQSPSMIIAYHLGEQQYIKDTVAAESAGKFVFTGDEVLPVGMYIAFFPDVKKSFEFVISNNDQNFELTTDMNDLIPNMKVKNSAENELFFGYLNYLNKQRGELSGMNALLTQLKQQKTEAEAANKPSGDLDKKIKEVEEKLKALDEVVQNYQKDLVKNHPKTFTAGIILINTPIEVPEAIRKDTLGAFYYYRDHFFDNVDFTDERFLRSPMFHSKIDQFIGEKVTIQDPDSCVISSDFILKKAAVNEEYFKFCLIRLLNYYAKSKLLCMDKVYVHLVDNYYAVGKAPWMDEEQLKKIKEDADRLRPLRCGEIAPNVKMQTFDTPARAIALHQITSKYTVLFFWDPDCGHCQKSIPYVVEFYDSFKPLGIEVFGVCTKTYQGEKDCRDKIQEKDMGRFLNLIDPYYQSRYKQIYDIQATPVIYILDKDKHIIAKKLGAEQLSEVMQKIIERDEAREKKAKEEAAQKSKTEGQNSPNNNRKSFTNTPKSKVVQEAKE